VEARSTFARANRPGEVLSENTDTTGTGGSVEVRKDESLNVTLRPIASGSEVFENSAIGAVYKSTLT
jgi:hypothetical protein